MINREGDSMKHFEYEITQHSAESFTKVAFFCSEAGVCDLDQVPGDQREKITEILNERGGLGWELVKIYFGKDGMMAFWKRELI